MKSFVHQWIKIVIVIILSPAVLYAQSDSLQNSFTLKSSVQKIERVSLKKASSTNSNIIFSEQIIIQTGESIDGSNPIISIGNGPSINNYGKIAFTALEESKVNRTLFLYDNGNYVRNFNQTGYLPGVFVQVNDKDNIAFWSQFQIDPDLNTFIFRLYNDHDDPLEIVRGNPWIFRDFTTEFNSITPFFSLSNNNRIVFNGDLREGGSVLATGVAGCRYTYNDCTMSKVINGSPNFFPKISDNNRIVTKWVIDNTSPLVMFYDENLNNGRILADEPDFELVGNKPGISDDGNIAVFMAGHSNEGAGVYVTTVNNKGDAVQFKLAKLPGTNINLNYSIAVNKTGSSAYEYMVVYLADDSDGAHTLFAKTIDVANPYSPVLKSESTITKVGETIAGLDGNIKHINIFDPINNLGEIVFWVETETNNQAIILCKQESTITILYPNGGEVLPINRKVKIKWNSSGVNDVKIELSKDGKSWITLIEKVEANQREYEWLTPEIPSNKCLIKISDVANLGNYKISNKKFTLSYLLTRKSDEGIGYEIFDFNNNTWPFGNNTINSAPPYNGDYFMWPEYWWTRFDYGGFVGSELLLPLSVENGRFTDWPLWVNTFGEDQCYWNPPPGIEIANPKALWKWYNTSAPNIFERDIKKRYYKGACFGFAISIFLAFEYPDEFMNNFLLISGNFKQIQKLTIFNDLPKEEEVRKIINGLYLYQFGYDQTLFEDKQRRGNPFKTLNEIKQMLKEENRILRILTLNEINHAVNPYRVDVGDEVDTVYVYDNNYKNDSKIITINKTLNTWSYCPDDKEDRVIDEKKGIYLMDPIENYLCNPNLFKNNDETKALALQNNSFIEIYNLPGVSARITNSKGQNIAFTDTVINNSFEEGHAIIPITGFPHPPIGCFIPEDKYKFEFSNLRDSLNYFTLFTNSAVINYSRFDADTTQNEIFYYDNGFSTINTNSKVKTIILDYFLNQGMNPKIFKIEDYSLNQNDSLNLTNVNNENLRISNIGQDKTYKLTLCNYNESVECIIIDSIPFSANSSHIISPAWENLKNDSLLIFVDESNDGSINDTLFFKGLSTSTNIKNQNSLLSKFELFQNYPNPFKTGTVIKFTLPHSEKILLEVYNIFGQKVATLLDAVKSSGEHQFVFDATGLPSGFYFYSIKAGNFISIKKMQVLK